MSKAEPMTPQRRAELYRYPVMTTRQKRRYRHKLRRYLGTHLAGDGVYAGDKRHAKGRATPRRPRRG
jgi:hypothetical protein